MDALKRIHKIIRENAFELKIKKSGLKFKTGLALIGLRTTGPRILGSTSNIFPDLAFHKKKIPGFRNPDSLTRGDIVIV